MKKTRLKLLSIILASIFFLGTAIPGIVSSANATTTNSVTLELSKYTAQPRDSVTAAGTADADTWVTIKVLDSAQSIIVLEPVKTDAAGSYSCTFILPGASEGTLTVVAGYGSNIAVKTITVGAAPEDTTAPGWSSGKSLTATGVSQSGLTLSWSGASDNVGVTGYNVYQGSSLLTASPVAETSYTVTGLSAGTEYTFTVQAVDAAGNESTDGPSTVETTRPSSVSVTLELSKYTAQPGDSVTAAGTADADTWVTIKVLDSAQSIIVLEPVKTDAAGSYSCTFILPGASEETLTVVAGYGSNVAVKTITVGAAPEDTTAPGWSSGKSLTATGVSQSGLTLSWSGASDNVGVTGYNVYQGSSLLTASPVTETSYTVTGLSAGTEYTFTVQAVDAAGNESTDGPSTVETTSVPITDSNVTITDDGANKNLAVTADTPAAVTITVPAAVTDAKVSVEALLNTPASGTVSTTALPALTIAASTSVSAEPVEVSIPAGTILSAPAGWDGTINVPTVRSNDSVIVTPDNGNTATVDSVIEIGYGDIPLTFNKAVRILIPGQAGKDVGYTRGGVFTKITNIMSADSQEAGDALTPGSDGRIDDGHDLVIWTKHFTQFVTYTQTADVSDTTAPSWTEGSLTASIVSLSKLTLSWSGAEDNVAVIGYNVYQGTTLLTSSPVANTSYSVTGLRAGNRYTFTVQAVDAAGNKSIDGPSIYGLHDQRREH